MSLKTIIKGVAVLVLLGIWGSPAEAQLPDEFTFDFDPGKFRPMPGVKRTKPGLYWGFGPTFVQKGGDEAGYPLPEFKPFRSWSNDLGLVATTRLGSLQGRFSVQYGLLWRYLNVETDAAVLQWDNGQPRYVSSPDARMTEAHIHTLSVPLLVQYSGKVAVGLGGFLARRVASSSELHERLAGGVRQETILRADYGFRPWMYGLSAHLGARRFRVTCHYHLSSLFQEEVPYDVRLVQLGVAFF